MKRPKEARWEKACTEGESRNSGTCLCLCAGLYHGQQHPVGWIKRLTLSSKFRCQVDVGIIGIRKCVRAVFTTVGGVRVCKWHATRELKRLEAEASERDSRDRQMTNAQYKAEIDSYFAAIGSPNRHIAAFNRVKAAVQ